MNDSNGDKDNKNELQGTTGEGAGLSPELDPTCRNNMVLSNNKSIVQVNQQPPQPDQIYSRAHQVAAQAAAAAVQASQVPKASHLATGSQEIGRNGNGSRVVPLKQNVIIRPRRPLTQQERRKPATMVPRVPVPPQRQQKPESYTVASLLRNEKLQRDPGSGARTMALNPGSWGKGVKRRAPVDAEEDDAMSGEKLNITHKLKCGDSSNQEVDVVGGVKEEETNKVQDLSKGGIKSQNQLLHKLLFDENPEEAKPKVNATATATTTVDGFIMPPPPAESVHKKFEYKRWTAGVRANSNPDVAQGPNLAIRPASESLFTGVGQVNDPYSASGSINGSFMSVESTNGSYSGLKPFYGSYTPPALFSGAQNAEGLFNSTRFTLRPPIEAYGLPGMVNRAQNEPESWTAGRYFGIGPFNGLQNTGCALHGIQYASGSVNTPYPAAGEVDRVTPVKPVSGPAIATGTLRELLSAKTPLQNPYGHAVSDTKGPTPSTSSAAVGNGRPVIPPEQLQRMLGELVLSPYITETQAVARLKTLGTTQRVQAEIDRFAAIISCGNAFAASRENGHNSQQQEQQQEQQRKDNATCISVAANDLLQAKHRESVIKGVPKK